MRQHVLAREGRPGLCSIPTALVRRSCLAWRLRADRHATEGAHRPSLCVWPVGALEPGALAAVGRCPAQMRGEWRGGGAKTREGGQSFQAGGQGKTRVPAVWKVPCQDLTLLHFPDVVSV